LEIYRGYAEALLKDGLAYRCFCTKEELEAMRRDALKEGRPPVYSGRCRSIPEDVVAKLESEGRPYVISSSP
jgi:glutamyl/glutaminyl-tRNA synthetase